MSPTQCPPSRINAWSGILRTVMKLKEIGVDLDLKFLKLSGKWSPDEEERKAAWEMYVELITRISVAELRPDEGLLREALSSLHSLFDTTRKILKDHGPDVARPSKDGDLSFGFIAVAVLNLHLRPILSKWHPMLLDHENCRVADVSAFAHEKAWEHSKTLRKVLNDLRPTMIDYANLLAAAANVPPLILDRNQVQH